MQKDLHERGDYQPFFQITVLDTPLFHESTLKTWLRGSEYHQDGDKAKLIAAIEKVLTTVVARQIFVAQLSGRMKAVLGLGDLADMVAAKIPRVQVCCRLRLL